MRVALVAAVLLVSLAALPLLAGDRDPQARVTRKFTDIAEGVMKKVLRKVPEEEQQKIAAEFRVPVSELPRKMAERFMASSQQAFTMTDEQARKLLHREFDDRGNRKRLKKVARVFDKLTFELPSMTRHILEMGQRSHGMRLEFAARHLVFILKKIKAAL